MFGTFDKNHEKILGCTTVNRLHITPIGDVLCARMFTLKLGTFMRIHLKK